MRATEKNPQFTTKDFEDDLMKGDNMQSIRKTLDKHDLHVETSCQMPLLSKKNIKGPLE